MTNDSNYWKFATFLLGGLVVGYLIAKASPGALMGDLTKLDENVKPVQVQVDSGAGEIAPSVVVEVTADDDAMLGDADAPIEIIEFSDYQCSYCQRFHAYSYPDLLKNYIETGKVKFVYRDYPLTFHANSLNAAIAAECAGDQDNYWEMHGKLFDNLAAWSGSTDAGSIFSSYADELGLDVDSFESCYNGADVQEEIKGDMRDALNAGVRATPTFFINGQKLEGAQPYSVFESILESILAE